jgi:1,4-alpha-glucan branching enzyme
MMQSKPTDHPQGQFTFVLHTHLPYVLGHGTWPHGTDWLNEATAECYIPLLRVLDRLEDEGILPAITINLSPILCEQLVHPRFVRQFDGYLRRRMESSEEERLYFAHQEDPRESLAQFWRDWYRETQRDFHERYGENLVQAFRRKQDAGQIEIITCAATHGYLPLLGSDEAVRAQVRLGVATYQRHFGRRPRGVWLPECAYRPAYRWTHPVDFPGRRTFDRAGLEEVVFDAGLGYFIVDSHLLDGSKPIGVYLDRYEGLKRLWGEFRDAYPQIESRPLTPHQAYWVSSQGGPKIAAILARDSQTALQVWSGEHGYPGDGQYLDFHKKYFPSGNRYWRVTHPRADLADKKPYEPELVQGRLLENAEHFASLVRNNLTQYQAQAGSPGLLVAPFDTELFGHWWFEGPEFLYLVCQAIGNADDIVPSTGVGMLETLPPAQIIQLPEGSWGEGGHHWIWLNGLTEWVWKEIYSAEEAMTDWATRLSASSDPWVQRLLRQMGRELLLLESSDWPFLISTVAARDYAEERVHFHSDAFGRLANILQAFNSTAALPQEDGGYLELLEEQDDPFPEIDPKWWVR